MQITSYFLLIIYFQLSPGITELDPHAAFGSTIRKMKKCQGDLVDFRSERSTE